jgi:hypothetical protein
LREYLGQLRKADQGPEAKAAAVALDNLLATWPRKRDRQRLLDACVTALLQGEGKGPPGAFGSPATQRVLTWCLLQELIYGRTPDGYDRPGVNFAYHSWDENRLFLDGGVAAKLTDHCRQVIATGPEAEKPFAASVLLSRSVGWPRSSNAERKELFLSPQPSVWRWAAMSLVKNGWREELVRWAPRRPAADHLDIIWLLAHHMPKEWPRAELDFWLTCARRTPGGVAYVLDLFGKGDIPLAFRPPIRSYLEKEIANPTVKGMGTQEASYLFAAVSVLDRWKNADDTPLLLKYLHHPCLRLRGYVKSMLEKRGVKPPPGIVYE